MQDKIITVRPHPSNPEGWAIYEGEKMAELLNTNFFVKEENAQTVATARRHVRMRMTLKELTGLNNI